MLRFDGKVIFVTGCGSTGRGVGNGKAISILFARQGGCVYGVDRNLQAAQETADAVRGEGFSMTVAQCDVTDRAQVIASVEDCVSKFKRIDVLVNNVGASAAGNAINMSEEVWDAQMDLNLKSVFLCCKAVLPIMQKQATGGAVVNVSSIGGMRHVGPELVAYAASKAAVIQYTKSTAVDCLQQNSNIRLNTVVPGLMDTPLVRERVLKQLGGTYEELVARRAAQVPMGRMGQPWDVAHAVLFLASSEAGYITGTEIVVDGGVTATAGYGKPKAAL